MRRETHVAQNRAFVTTGLPGVLALTYVRVSQQ